MIAKKQPSITTLITMLIAIEGIEVPDNVLCVLTSIQQALFSNNPRASLSRRCCRLREARGGVFREVWQWLRTPEVRAAVRGSGAFWPWKAWCRACAAIHKGVKPHVAFGMNKPGRPIPMHFSAADDAAMYAEYLDRCLNVPSNEAEERALIKSTDMRDSDNEVNRRTLQRKRKIYESCGDGLKGLPHALGMKYPKFKK